MDQALKLQEVDDRSKSNQRRIEDLEKDMKVYLETMTRIVSIDARLQRVESDVKETKTDIKSIKDKPAKRWDAIIDKIIMTLLGAVIMFLLAKIGMV